MMPLKHSPKLRALLPRSAREVMYQWHPGRARRWERHAGLQRLAVRGQAVITFDDGPDEDATPAILDALDEANAKATFFMLGSQVETHADIAREVASRGHEIGLHGYQHDRHDRLQPAVSRRDVTSGFGTIEDRMGVRCRWYRPPYGKMAAASAEACDELGMTTVYWSAWGLDWESVGPRRIADVACKQLSDGAILLLHDSARYGRRPSALATARAIPLIAERAAARGMSLVSLGEARSA